VQRIRLIDFFPKMNFISSNPKDATSLKKPREVLIRLEDSIIFGNCFFFFIINSCRQTNFPIKFATLIERAQLAVNNKIYKPGTYIYEGISDFNGSFFDYFLRESEILHGILLKLFVK